MTVLRENNVVQYRYADGFSRKPQPRGYVEIVYARFEIAARVIVRDNETGGPFRDRFNENLSWMNERSVNEPDRDDAAEQDLVRAVEPYGQKIFLLAVGPMAEQGNYVRRLGYPHAVGQEQSAREFEGAAHECRFGLANAVDVAKRVDAGESVLALEDRKHFLRELSDRPGPCTGAEYGLDEVYVAECIGTARSRPFARHKPMRVFTDPETEVLLAFHALIDLVASVPAFAGSQKYTFFMIPASF